MRSWRRPLWPPPLPRAAGVAERGATLAAHRCANCHGLDGISQTPGVPSLAGQQPQFVTLQMILFREKLRNAPPMPEFAQGLSDQQIEDLAAYYASLRPGPAKDRAPRDAELAARGQALAERLNCGVCHLSDYAGRNQMSRLAAQREEFLEHALRQYRDNERAGTDTQMNGVVYGLSDADIAALAHYLAHTGG